MEKKMEEFSYLALILVLLTIIFMVVQALVWVGVIDVPALGNLNKGLDELFENPSFVGLLSTLFVGVFSGFMENWSITGETFRGEKFAETFYYYEPLLILVSQWLPMNYAVVLTFGVDVLRRITERLKTPSETPIPPYPPPVPGTVLSKKVLENVRVYVDDAVYPESPEETGCKVGCYKVLMDETTKWKTSVRVGFVDYNPHLVKIIADGKTVFDDVLQYGQMVKT